MTKILIIDDDNSVLKSVEIGLGQAGFRVLTAKDGATGLRTMFDNRPDLVLLDIMLPGIDGMEACRRLRELSDTPIIFLTALSAETDIVKGLMAGADDYITKPFSMSELIARIHTCLRRKKTPTGERAPSLILGDLTIDFVRHQVRVRDQQVTLSPTEFRLLSYLARNCGQVISHQALLTEVWGPEYASQYDYLHLYIRYLRKKIEKDPSRPEIIKTERGVGYYMNEY
jgi:two-component system, OmpR family, KDP operon response regulator KdpE